MEYICRVSQLSFCFFFLFLSHEYLIYSLLERLWCIRPSIRGIWNLWPISLIEPMKSFWYGPCFKSTLRWAHNSESFRFSRSASSSPRNSKKRAHGPLSLEIGKRIATIPKSLYHDIRVLLYSEPLNEVPHCLDLNRLHAHDSLHNIQYIFVTEESNIVVGSPRIIRKDP